MNEDERLKYLQGSLLPDKDDTLQGALDTLTNPDGTGATKVSHSFGGGAFEPVCRCIFDGKDKCPAHGVINLHLDPEVAQALTDDIDPDLMPDDECDAVGVPHGWPRRWLGRSWPIEGSETPLTGADIAQVYLAISASGSTVDALCEHALCNWLSRPHIVRALALLLNQGLVVKDDEGKWFAAVEMPKPETEPGRKDTLPEAAVAPKPKRRGAKDTGEALLNSALEQSEGHVH
jgi:hypothetical protein